MHLTTEAPEKVRPMDPEMIDPEGRYVVLDALGRHLHVRTDAGMPHAAILFASSIAKRSVMVLDEEEVFTKPLPHLLVWFGDLAFAVYRASDRPDIAPNDRSEEVPA